eukprot:PhF_6_TR29181/c0_g3_i1/m.42677
MLQQHRSCVRRHVIRSSSSSSASSLLYLSHRRQYVTTTPVTPPTTTATAAASSSSSCCSIDAPPSEEMLLWLRGGRKILTTSSGVVGGTILTHQTHERMDFALECKVPKQWEIKTQVRENFLLLRAMPQDSPLEGLSINAFAYHKKLSAANASPTALLARFSKQFSTTMHTFEPITTANVSTTLPRSQIPVMHMEFTTKACPVKARGLMTAFYHPNHRYHYVCVMAVRKTLWDTYPVEVFEFCEDLLTQVNCLTFDN